MKDKEESCGCNAGNRGVMACSGASDVGLIADRVARAIQVSGKRKMNCLAMVGADIEKSIAGFKTKELLVIDGCPIACGKRMLDQHHFENYKHLVVTEQGFKKGDSPATDDNVRKVLEKALSLETA